MNKIANYSTNLTENQWKIIEKIINSNRKRKNNLRDILNALFYLVKTGCQWRMLPTNFAPWNSVYYYYRLWKNTGLIEEIHDVMRGLIRKLEGRDESPSAACIDSRSIKTTRSGSECKGVDGGKKIKGRKQHIVTDTTGLLLAVKVHAANIHDSKAAESVLEKLEWRFDRLTKIYADGGYRGDLETRIENIYGWVIEIVLRTDTQKEFVAMPKRWVVERTFSWFESYRRLAKDYEFLNESSETIIQLSMLKLMLNRIK